MSAFLQSKTVKIIGGGIVAILLLGITIAVALSFLSNNHSYSTGLYGNSFDSVENVSVSNRMMAPQGGMGLTEVVSDYYEPPYIPTPTPGGYTPDLETFETTNYYVSGRLRAFDEACDTLASLKADDRYHFKTLNTGLNHCRATFYTEDTYISQVMNTLEQYNGVTASWDTTSVTRHRENLESRDTIVRQQLASVERTLREAETAYDEIATFARSTRDAATLSKAIDSKLRQVEQLTQRKISLSSQLDTLAQQAADLNERLDMVEVSVNFTRSFAKNPDDTSRAWEAAWETLRDTWTNFGIGLTAYFGVFLLYVLQYGLYLLVLIVVARFGWKLVRKIWRL